MFLPKGDFKLVSKFKFILKDYYSLFLCIGILIISPIFIDGFLRPLNLLNVLVEASIMGILAIGMTFLLLNGMFDMSIGMQVSLCGLVTVFSLRFGIIPSIIITILAGLLVGVINGLITTKFKINPFITTFAAMGILKGINLLISDGKSISVKNLSFNELYSFNIFNIPIVVFVFIALAVIAQIFIKYTKTGFNLYLCGGNREAARFSGVNTDLITIISFVVMSFYCAIVSILMVSRVNSASPILGEKYTLIVITACIIGGVKFTGGYGNIINMFLGVLAMQLINNVMYMTNTYGYIQSLINGMVLLAVLSIEKFAELISSTEGREKNSDGRKIYRRR